jgi:hypothetical protein
MQLMLKLPDTASGRFSQPTVYDSAFVPQTYVYSNWANTIGTPGSASPFSWNSNVIRRGTSGTIEWARAIKTNPNDPNTETFQTGGTPPDALTVQHSRTDILGMGIDRAREGLAAYAAANPTDWWSSLLTTNHRNRFNANPFPNRPFNSKKMGQRHQILAEACTQFIVEFAGDFVTQDPTTGNRTGTAPDGVIDFERVGSIRQIRWYGMPRDVNGDGLVNATSGGDVVPLRDFRGASAPFERHLPPPESNYMTAITDVGAGPNGYFGPNGTRYVCVWGPNELDRTNAAFAGVPSMLRIIVELRDPEGKLTQPVTQEYVFRVPQ